jgi:hypothetical protein
MIRFARAVMTIVKLRHFCQFKPDALIVLQLQWHLIIKDVQLCPKVIEGDIMDELFSRYLNLIFNIWNISEICKDLGRKVGVRLRWA